VDPKTKHPAVTCSDVYQNNLEPKNDNFWINLFGTLDNEINVYCLNEVSDERLKIGGGWMLTLSY